MRFLSPEWFEHMSALMGAATTDADLSVHQLVTGGPDGDVEYTLRLTGGTVSFEPGPASADVDLSTDYETAAAISRGRLTPAAAFAAGRLRVGGSVTSLAAHSDAIAEVGALLAGAAGATTY